MIEEIFLTNKEIDERYNRSGKCDFKKCKAACCRFYLIGIVNTINSERYMKGFGFKIITQNGMRKAILPIVCNHLDLKTYECKIQSKKPLCCKQFPVPEDGVYKLVADKCSYKFKGNIVIKMGGE